MAINGNFLEGHRKGFDEGLAEGWRAGYLRAMQDTGAAPVGPVPPPMDITYVAPPIDHLNSKLEDLFKDGLISTRAYHCLIREELHTIGEVVAMTEVDLNDIRNMGEKTLNEIKALLAGMDLALKESKQ